MNYSLAAFYEPRGVMRIFQFVFAIWAFASTTNFSVSVKRGDNVSVIDYPFNYMLPCNESTTLPPFIAVDVSSDAQFFVATGVLSLMYCIFVVAVYGLFDELYKSKSEIPLADFMLTTVLAIFWLSGSAAWANGTSTLKTATDPEVLQKNCQDEAGTEIVTSSFSSLNISLILGFLNFFLWASDLWFLYKETIWFQGRSPTQPNGGTQSSITPTV